MELLSEHVAVLDRMTTTLRGIEVAIREMDDEDDEGEEWKRGYDEVDEEEQPWRR